MSLKRTRSSSPTPTVSTPHLKPPSIYPSSPISDRSSTFIAHYSPSLTAKSLQAHPDFTSASHRIAAWRKPSKQSALSGQTLYDTGSDEDGEKYAGKKLEKVLGEMNVSGTVVVARWYGGVLLGPVRFSHIENCAREAIGKWVEESRNEANKRRRVDADEAERWRLMQELIERDKSIGVLRGLLMEKQRQGGAGQPGSDAITSTGSPAKAVDYTKMSMDALRRLDKARDATIGWLLREIDKAESGSRSPERSDVPRISQKDTKTN